MRRDVLEHMGLFFECDIGRAPFSYLGINVGINHRKNKAWSNLIGKIRNRLAKWNGKHISFEGRITLIQYVLASIPIYYLSFYCLPNKTLKVISIIEREFFWGRGCELNSKRIWVRWGDVRRDKNDGGLGIRDVGCFNDALVQKWIWRFLNESNRLWARVIRSK